MLDWRYRWSTFLRWLVVGLMALHLMMDDERDLLIWFGLIVLTVSLSLDLYERPWEESTLAQVVGLASRVDGVSASEPAANLTSNLNEETAQSIGTEQND